MKMFTTINLPTAMGFPIPGNETMYGIITLLAEMTALLTYILFVIFVVLAYIHDFFRSEVNPYPHHFEKTVESTLDVLFVVFPTAIVIYMLVPSLGFIFSGELDATMAFDITVTAHQWYWSYEYTLGTPWLYGIEINMGSGKTIEFGFDSLLNTEATKNRLLEVDNRLILPHNTLIRCSVTSQDVIHSWAVPQLGIKVDAIPGRLNTFIFSTGTGGVFYGQCSEPCGVNHGFMPIAVQVVSSEMFESWVILMSGNNVFIPLLELIEGVKHTP
jgi:cytochrome c oxidase subunit 2